MAFTHSMLAQITTDAQLEDYVQERIQLVLLATAPQDGQQVAPDEPVAWMYRTNRTRTLFSDTLPPDDAYDEGTLVPLFTYPATEQAALAAHTASYTAGFASGKEFGLSIARHAAPEQAAPAAAAGWKLVPVEPTWDMQMAASSNYREPRDGHYTARMECAADAYRAMLAAAPEPAAAAVPADLHAAIVENGPWEAVHNGTEVALASDDFTHDAWLKVTGNFESFDQRMEYAREIARRLNAAADLVAAAQAVPAGDARRLYFELRGVIVDVEQGPGFDAVCLETIKRVAAALAAAQPAAPTGEAAPAPRKDELDAVRFTEDEIAQACMEAEVPDSRCESILIALAALRRGA